MNYLSFSIRRSGTHVLANWLLAQCHGATLYFHNAMIGNNNIMLPQAMYCLNINGKMIPVQVPVLHGQHNRQAKEQPLAHVVPFRFNDPYCLEKPAQEGETFFGGKLPEISRRYYGFENCFPINFFVTDMFERLDPKENTLIFWLRDPIDNLASLIARSRKEPVCRQCGKKHVSQDGLPSSHLLPTDNFPRLWAQMARCWLQDSPKLDSVRMLYELWFHSPAYRKQLAEHLHVDEITDAGKDHICKAGGGSSFEGKKADASSLGRSRGREMYRDEPIFRKFVEERLIPVVSEVYSEVYEHTLDPAITFDYGKVIE